MLNSQKCPNDKTNNATIYILNKNNKVKIVFLAFFKTKSIIKLPQSIFQVIHGQSITKVIRSTFPDI